MSIWFLVALAVVVLVRGYKGAVAHPAFSPCAWLYHVVSCGYTFGRWGMEWTSDAPKCDGWYWWRQDEADEPEVGCVAADRLTATFANDDDVYSFSQLGGQWQGPIAPDTTDNAALRAEVERLTESLEKEKATVARLVEDMETDLCGTCWVRDDIIERERLRAAHIAESGTEGCLCAHCILRVGIGAQIRRGE